MRVCFVASEVAPWSKTGGLGDVCGALPRALQATGDIQVGVFTPLYRSARSALSKRGLVPVETGVPAQLGGDQTGRWLRLARDGEADVFFLECDALYDREGVYGFASGSAYGSGGFSDNATRFAALSRAAVAAAPALLGGAVDIVHGHDWQAALAIHEASALSPRPATILTIHNLAHQGAYAPGDARAAGITRAGTPESYWSGDVLHLLKGAISEASVVSTVSPHYAHEVTTPAFGMGLDGLLAHRGVHGIVNGLDIDGWDPANDRHTAAPFSAADPAGKRACRRALLKEVGLPDEPGVPVLGVVSRFDPQKGLDIVAQLVPLLHRLPARLVLLGTGAAALESQFRALGAKHHNHLAALVEFDIGRAHRIVAGSDMLLVPSRFEPCGLTQLQGMRYGAVPVVHSVGGLVDTVQDPGDAGLARGEGTGFAFDGLSVENLRRTLERAVRMYRQDPQGWAAVQQAGLDRDSSWGPSAETWAQLYRDAISA
jgi:starch synthase